MNIWQKLIMIKIIVILIRKIKWISNLTRRAAEIPNVFDKTEKGVVVHEPIPKIILFIYLNLL